MTSPVEEETRWGEDMDGPSVPEQLIEGLSSHAIFKLDDDGNIDAWTGSATTLYGYAPTQIVGQSLSALFAEADDAPSPDVDDLLERAKIGAQSLEHWNDRTDGSIFWATITLSPLRNGSFEGYAVVSHDTTAKKQYEQMLERQNDRLKEFTDILAHDLRNPLNVIDGRLELFQETREDEHLEHIGATTDRMERLVDDLLRVARQGNVVTDPEPTDLGEVIEAAWEGTGSLAEQAKLVYDEVGSVGGDYDRLREVFENLFRNATEHGGSDVTVRVGPLDQGFFVEDDGPGVPTEIQDQVFDHGFTTKETGSGYGLSVVRTIANAHGWDVRATAGESGSARFEFTGIQFLD